ncbi:MAG: BrnT family toxin [Gemmatimonadota bacterium]|nr:BrnT family toxin [Gemmatimonadota bacterium]
MEFSWDPRKSDETLRLRQLDFPFAIGIFAGPVVAYPDTRREYGELRMIAVGVVDGVLLSVVYTDRLTERGGFERRIISARRSSRKERKAYEESISKHG